VEYEILFFFIIFLISLLLSALPAYAWKYQYHSIKHLTNSATSDQHPDNGVLHVTQQTKFTAILTGDADVDLYMYLYRDGTWVEVARSNSEHWNEFLSYQSNEIDALYAWFVVLKSPNSTGGTYTIDIVGI